MDDRARKITSFRRQEWQSLPAGPERKTRPAFAVWPAAMAKQRKILFVQAVFHRRTPISRLPVDCARTALALGSESVVAEH
jgi:hypothetical protein